MRRLAAIPVLLAVALAACGSDEESTPAACSSDAGDYLAALEDAPGAVTLQGTPISDCLVREQGAADLNRVGGAMIEAATRLNRTARRRPAGEATMRLGYLVGAVQEGASETRGIHEDLIRRLDAAARFTDRDRRLPASFERAFGRGYAAGQESG